MPHAESRSTIMNTTSGLRTRGDTERDGQADGQGDRQTDETRMAEGQTGCWQRTERDRRGAGKTKAQDTHTATHCSSSHKERERKIWRGRGRGSGSGRKTKIVPGLGLLTDAAPSVIVFRALFHCLVATVIVFYCMGVRRGEQGKERRERRHGGEATVRVMRCWRVC